MIPTECWVTCSQGHQHWGGHGAAGLLLSHHDLYETDRFLLVYRAGHTHHGNSWGIPAGAIDLGRDASPVDTAIRETKEELGLDFLDVWKPHILHVNDHGGWRFTTIRAEAEQIILPDPNTFEHEIEYAAWIPEHDVPTLDLHPDFRQFWNTYGAVTYRDKWR